MRTHWIYRWLAVMVMIGFTGLRLIYAASSDEPLQRPKAEPRLLADESPKAKAEKNHAIQAVSHLYDGIRTETLPNGLKVYLKPIPESPIVTTMVAYKVGSCDEDLDNTGL